MVLHLIGYFVQHDFEKVLPGSKAKKAIGREEKKFLLKRNSYEKKWLVILGLIDTKLENKKRVHPYKERTLQL